MICFFATNDCFFAPIEYRFICRRVSDHKNYGDESDAYGVVNPSMYSQKGLTEDDFLGPRPRDEVRFVVFLYNSRDKNARGKVLSNHRGYNYCKKRLKITQKSYTKDGF